MLSPSMMCFALLLVSANGLKISQDDCSREAIAGTAESQLANRYKILLKEQLKGSSYDSKLPSMYDVMDYFGEAQNFYSDHMNQGPVCFDNLGFLDPNQEAPDEHEVQGSDPTLSAPCPDHYFDVLGKNMYKHMVTDGLSDGFLQGKSVLEVGSGRGKGAAYVTQTFHPQKYVGMDLNKDRVATARTAWGTAKNLEFIEGNALDIPLPEGNVDVVLNVESSFHYPNFPKFLSEVFRVLKPGGVFLWTSPLFNRDDTVEKKIQVFQNAGFEFLKKSDISANVILARQQGLEKCSPGTLMRLCYALSTVPEFWDFAALEGGVTYGAIKSGQSPYVRFIVKKPSLP